MPTYIALLQMFLIAAACGVSCYLFVSLKREIAGAEKRRKGDLRSAELRTAELKGRIDELRKDLETLPLPVAASPPAAMNLNKRTQALRMVRLGEGPEHVAAALNLPRKEVELLVKVQKLIVDTAAGTRA